MYERVFYVTISNVVNSFEYCLDTKRAVKGKARLTLLPVFIAGGLLWRGFSWFGYHAS